MHLTQQTDYALRILMYTASNPSTLVTISDIAEHYTLSKSYLMKVTMALVKQHYLASVRGKNGGLKLARAAELINIGAVVRDMEPMVFTECMSNTNQCLLLPCCRLKSTLHRATQAFLHVLDHVSLADLLDSQVQQLLATQRVVVVAGQKPAKIA